ALAALCGGSQTGAAAVAGHGFDGRLSQAAFESQPLGAQAFPVFAEGFGHRAAQSSLEHRHHLYSAAGRVRLSGGGHRLVQPYSDSPEAFMMLLICPDLGVISTTEQKPQPKRVALRFSRSRSDKNSRGRLGARKPMLKLAVLGRQK